MEENKTLKVDMDWIPPRNYILLYKLLIHKVVEWFSKVKIEKIRVYKSRSGEGLHFYIYLDKSLEDEERLILQFLLGDDRNRCKLNWQSIQIGMNDWNKFYRYYEYKLVKI